MSPREHISTFSTFWLTRDEELRADMVCCAHEGLLIWYWVSRFWRSWYYANIKQHRSMNWDKIVYTLPQVPAVLWRTLWTQTITHSSNNFTQIDWIQVISRTLQCFYYLRYYVLAHNMITFLWHFDDVWQTTHMSSTNMMHNTAIYLVDILIYFLSIRYFHWICKC